MIVHFYVQTPDGDDHDVRYPSEKSAEELLWEFVTSENIKIEPKDATVWHLEHEANGHKLDLKKSVEHNGVRDGHRLKLVHDEVRQASPGKGLTRCENGHFYDGDKFSRCPYDAAQNLDPSTRSIRIGPSGGRQVERDTIPVRSGGSTEPGDDQPTRRIGQGGPGGIDAVVGWLVCVHGKNRGRDYRIRSENNAVGRSEDMDICILGDDLISRDRHTIITFDPQQNTFHLSPAEGRSLVFLNSKAVLTPQQLNAYDEILLGATKLRFVPFCGEKFKWS